MTIGKPYTGGDTNNNDAKKYNPLKKQWGVLLLRCLSGICPAMARRDVLALQPCL